MYCIKVLISFKGLLPIPRLYVPQFQNSSTFFCFEHLFVPLTKKKWDSHLRVHPHKFSEKKKERNDFILNVFFVLKVVLNRNVILSVTLIIKTNPWKFFFYTAYLDRFLAISVPFFFSLKTVISVANCKGDQQSRVNVQRVLK